MVYITVFFLTAFHKQLNSVYKMFFGLTNIIICNNIHKSKMKAYYL